MLKKKKIIPTQGSAVIVAAEGTFQLLWTRLNAKQGRSEDGCSTALAKVHRERSQMAAEVCWLKTEVSQ